MNTRDKCKALMLIMLLVVFLVQCRAHQQLDVGTARDSAYSLTNQFEFCETVTQCGAENKVCYCCWKQDPKPVCYDHWDECSEKCPRGR
ncbi:hypothetical protein SETIT_4G010400v2 [Setaria italica]|uniref:Embryo surrounding factor 1 brassicaceae domain-containing protein n=1 Tax=Setaria italica TaxID=4555 RepID=A0A368QQ42_SETIT|nr:hypothetical protein SETIT_4G010400v2 [Setaria italica]